MCGIAGGLHLGKDHLDLMLESLRHRGPDGRGSFQLGAFSVGMTRLAILDRKNGTQPFVSACGKVYAVCNGEIYNWLELRRELESRGHRFYSQCDCEIIPAAWLEWQHGMLDRFNGMFAMALCDRESGELFLARDRCGQKPLYVTAHGPFRFASEIKALEAAGVSLTPDPEHLAQWLSLRYIEEPATFYQDIETLPAAHWMTLSKDGKRQIRHYWKPPPLPRRDQLKQKTRTVDTSIEELDQLTRSSVELALQSDVPVASYLSAGVDSCLLAHYVHDLGADVTSVSIGFSAESDETKDAGRFAKRLGVDHHPTQLSPESLHDLPRVISQMDRPVGDALILAFDKLALHTAGLGCKVALGGEGPDEHFAGYSFHKAYITASRLGTLGRSLASTALEVCPQFLINKLSQFPADLGPEGRKKIIRYLDRFDTLSPDRQSTALRTLFGPDDIRKLLHPDTLFAQAIPDKPARRPERDALLDFALRNQYSSWLPDWSLIRQEKNTMAHSVEYRAPFLDHRIIDFAFGLPDDFKIRGRADKWIWRQLAQKHLPDDVTQRRKQPFYLPLENSGWRSALIELAHDILKPSSYSCNGWLAPQAVRQLLGATHFLPLKQLAAIIILQLWLDQCS